MNAIEKRSLDYKLAKKRYDIFDASVYWDPMLKDAFVCYSEWAQQKAALTEAGIKGGVVTSAFAMKVDQYQGNEELAKTIKDDDAFWPCMVATPDMFLDELEGEVYLKKMVEANKVVAAKMIPSYYHHSVEEYCIGNMLDALSRHNIPLFVWHIDTGFDGIDRICQAHPALNVVLDSMDRKLLYHARDYYFLLKNHNNFYIETHNLVLFNEIEEIYRMFGGEHLLYGSYSPYACPDFSIYPIIEADLPESIKQKILAGNARRIFRKEKNQ